MILTEEVLANAAIVVAHADDEALWFSSVLSKVRAIVICFLDSPDQPQINAGRLQTIRNYPRSGVGCLGLSESNSFNLANWEKPQRTEYGLKLEKSESVNELYHDSYLRLTKLLAGALEGVTTVFTHNPWGEYGHEDHVQVYRAVREVQERNRFRIFYSSYASNRSVALMSEYLNDFDTQYYRVETDIALANRIAELYKANKCWTWYPDYQWFPEEFFVEDLVEPRPGLGRGQLFPINLIRIDFGLNQRVRKRTLQGRMTKQVRKLVGRRKIRGSAP